MTRRQNSRAGEKGGRMQVEPNEGHYAQLLEAVLLAVGDPIVIFDSAWKLAQCNETARSAFPEAQKDAQPESIFRDDSFAQALRTNSVPAEWQNSANDHIFIPHLVEQKNNREQVERYVLVLRDITVYKKLNRNQSEFIHIVSHDLRSPLTTIKGYSSMIGMAGPLNEKQKDYSDRVMSGIQQLTSLVDNIQDAGRFDIETGFYVMQRSQCDVSDIVNRVMNSYLIPAEKQELKLKVDIAPDVPIINADTNMLERALTNLVDNAIKYTPNGGTVTVRAVRKDDRLVLSVTDTGLGIPPDDQKKLFHRHSRLVREEHKRIKGTGLGLFIVKSVAQRHGGDAWVESTINVGSTFGLFLPLTGANMIFGGANS